jgi:hypothetical protein
MWAGLSSLDGRIGEEEHERGGDQEMGPGGASRGET